MISFDSMMPVNVAREKIVALGLKKQRFSIKSTPVRVLDEGYIGVETDEGVKPLSRVAATQLANLTGIKKLVLLDYLDNPDLLKKMIDHSLGKRSGEIQMDFYKDYVYNISSGDHKHIEPLEVFDISAAAIGGATKIDTIGFNEKGLAVRFVTEQNANPIRRVGDMTHGGVIVTANGHVSAAPYLFRLSCTNGMVREYSYPDMTKEVNVVREYIKTTIANLVEQCKSELATFMKADEHVVDNPPALFNRISRENGISDRDARLLSDALPSMEREGAQYSFYDMINLVSSMANTTGHDKFQKMAGDFLRSYQQHRCNTCGSRLVE